MNAEELFHAKQVQAVVSGPNRQRNMSFQGYCEIHQDGVNERTRDKAQEWCDRHNAKEHKESK